ncbi:TIGR01459 family HAD-type hydrolase [Plastoroseomonas hellenica]|uniref:TIGR01459 family HAD-type hydrolase n=1 Tax=Plastoroseomonas hellenica TaxID=2687306 RepID=UPI001BA5F6D9|nr:TIGR01459 family HAD-type hydrolase [Plastoroseomonas hellenica]MBR0644986.1 TIGR01459 family HAD-type hydrolase [Plastoroseomonas hellenica]
MKILDGIADIAEHYDAYVLDLWGVIHDGRAPYPGVLDALAKLRERGKRVVFLTNAPRRAWFIDGMLERMGVARGLYDETMSSGEASWRMLRDRKHPFFAGFGHRAFHIGPERDLSVVEEGVAEIVPTPEEAEFLLNTGPEAEVHGATSAEPYRPILERCLAQRLPMVCVNPDRAVMVAGQRLICAGALADIYLEGGGQVIEIGKPDPAVYGPVLEALGNPPRERVLAIGDTPHTDLAGAKAIGVDCLWAMTGLAGDTHGPNPDPQVLAQEAAHHDVTPLAALRSFRW